MLCESTLDILYSSVPKVSTVCEHNISAVLYAWLKRKIISQRFLQKRIKKERKKEEKNKKKKKQKTKKHTHTHTNDTHCFPVLPTVFDSGDLMESLEYIISCPDRWMLAAIGSPGHTIRSSLETLGLWYSLISWAWIRWDWDVIGWDSYHSLRECIRALLGVL